MNENTVIIARHPGVVEWLKNHGIEGRVLVQASPDDVWGKVVVGILPPHLACLASEIVTIDMPGLRADQRGKELTVQEMDEAGAKLSRKVTFSLDQLVGEGMPSIKLDFDQGNVEIRDKNKDGEYFYASCPSNNAIEFIKAFHAWSVWKQS